MHPALPGLLYFSALVAANPSSAPTGFHQLAPRQSGIDWQPCKNDSSSPVRCGRFEVPLDWANDAAGKASLYVARYPATVQPKLGTLFTNPGGPGLSGVEDMIVGGKQIMNITGGQYDLVSWDPRGVGSTVPSAKCFATGTEESAFWEGTILDEGIEARSNFTDPADIQAFYDQAPEVDDLLTKLGQKCVEQSPDTLQYVGTAATVRDMVALHDYLEGTDKPLNYWGFAYGTVVGIYFVNMFPNRVGRVVLDGVVDPAYWANRPAYEMWSINVESTDEALTGFVTACATAGPAGCAFASPGSTPDSLSVQIRQLIDMAYEYKKAAGADGEYGSALICDVLFDGMYNPSQWPDLAKELVEYWDFLTGNGTSSSTKRSIPFHRKRQATNSSDPAPNYSYQAITCADAVDAGSTTTQNVFDEIVRVTKDVSQVFGPSWGIAGFYCHRWPVRAVERYTGPWNNKLANPILVIGNEADPITPFRSAKSVADALGDSAILVEQDDYGHLSLAMHSGCTSKIIGNYFLNNQLPSTDQFCGTDQQLFPGPSVTKSYLASLSGNNSTGSTDLQSQLEQERTRARQLFVTVITLAIATGLLLVWLVWSCLFGKKRESNKKEVVYWGKEDESGQGHSYETPYDGTTALKVGGGYAPVTT